MDDPVLAPLLNVDASKIDYGAALGQGAFGQVRAADYEGQRVAIKAQDVTVDSEDFEYLVREMKIMVELKHPNILQLIAAAKEDLGNDRERYLLLMEICEIGDLRKLSTRRIRENKPLTWFQVTFIMLGAARGIDHLHSNGVLHRDIKTENLLIGSGMVCKIADFGMSRQEAVPRGEMDNKRMTLCGTDEFMAPEILFEEPYNFQADSFSFGVVLAEMLCRTVPGRKTGFLQRSPRNQFNVDFEDLEARMEKVADSPLQLRELCKESLAYDMDDRACSDDIVDWLEGAFEEMEGTADRETLNEENHRVVSPPSSAQVERATINVPALGAKTEGDEVKPPAFDTDNFENNTDDDTDSDGGDTVELVPSGDDGGDTESMDDIDEDEDTDTESVPPPPPERDPVSDNDDEDEATEVQKPVSKVEEGSQVKRKGPPLPPIPLSCTASHAGAKKTGRKASEDSLSSLDETAALATLRSLSITPPSGRASRRRSGRMSLSAYGSTLASKKAARSRDALKASVKKVAAPEDSSAVEAVLSSVENMTAALEALQRYLRPVEADGDRRPVVPLHGFMAKKSKYVKKWKEWFFILRRGQLEYYETLHFACQGKRRRGVIQLARANVVLLETPTSDRKWPCAMNIFPLKGKAKSISLACESKEDLLLWKHTLDNEIAASVSSAVEMQLKAALRRGPLSQHTRQDKAYATAQTAMFTASSPRSAARAPATTKGATAESKRAFDARRRITDGLIAEQRVYIDNLSFLRQYYITPLWDEIRRVQSRSSKSFKPTTAHALAQILPRPTTVESIESVHKELLHHMERVVMGWPAIPITSGILGILPYLRVYKTYAAHVTPVAAKNIEQLCRSDVGWSNLLEFLFHNAHWDLRCPLDLEAHKPANSGKSLSFLGLLLFPCTRILALQNNFRDLAMAFRPNASDHETDAALMLTERRGLCRAIKLLQKVNRDVKQTSINMTSQRNLLRLKKTITQLAYHSLDDVPGHVLRRSDTLLGEVGTNSGMKMKLQVVLINNALLLFKFVDTAYVPPPGESPPTELHLKIPLSTANLSFEKSQNGITVRVQRQVLARLYMQPDEREEWITTANKLLAPFTLETY